MSFIDVNYRTNFVINLPVKISVYLICEKSKQLYQNKIYDKYVQN